MDKLKRYLIFLVGLFVNSLGSVLSPSEPGNVANLIDPVCIKP